MSTGTPRIAARRRLVLGAVAAVLLGSGAIQAQETAAERGRYVFDAAGCLGCHTDVKGQGPSLAGGRALETEFGTFYGPNITPHRVHGIGTWQEADFIRAMREGRAPDGRRYYPAFPYTSYTRMTDQDMSDLWAYLRSVAPEDRESRRHDLHFPYNQRWLMAVWQMLFFTPGPEEPPSDRPAAWQRGAYLTDALGHCGECHSPRNAFGAVDRERALSGNEVEGTGAVPGIRAGSGGRLHNWSEQDIVQALRSGLLPDGDFMGGDMAEVVEHSTSRLTDADRQAIATYLKSLD